MKTKIFLSVIFLFFLILSSFNVRTALAQEDSVIAESIFNISAEETLTVDIKVYVSEGLRGLGIPLTFWDDQNAQIYCDSVQWSEWFYSDSADMHSGDKDTPPGEYIDNSEKTVLIWAVWFGGDLSPLEGDTAAVLATLWFHTGEFWYDDIPVEIDTTMILKGTSENYLEFSTALGAKINPVFTKGGFLDVREIPVEEGNFPDNFSLDQNYPNPFNLTTHIRFALPQDSWVKIEIFNVLGQRINILVDENLKAGYKEVTWDGRNLKGKEIASGIYFYRIKTESFTDIKKMVLLK